MDEGRARSRVRVPRGMADRAREFAAAGLRPAVPRDAATVILVRPETAPESRPESRPESAPEIETAGVEVYLLLRTQALEFAPGACVFPGGSVDARDADPSIAETGWAGPAPADFGHLLGVPADRARALVCAAVRETFEESGVLRADLLTPWARWITPEVSPRRFDTWFFAAALPAGQLAGLAPADQLAGLPAAGPGESDSGTWWRPAAALEAARAGQITLLPPTAVTLAELTAYQDVAGILGERRMITPLLPKVVVEDERAWLAMPHAIEYPL